MTRGHRLLSLYVGTILLLVCLGLVVGWWIWKPTPVIETPAAAETQSDGSIVLERKPDAQAKPAAKLPKGGKLERSVSVTVQPKTPEANLKLPGAVPCPPVRVDLALVRMDDKTKRVVASSPDGEVVAGLDMPIETAAPPPEPKKWAAGLSWDPQNRTPGAWIERDIGRIRLGAEINRARALTLGPAGTEIRLRAGLTF